MTGSLNFTLPEEQEDFELAVNAPRYQRAIQDFAEHLRAQLKYGELPDPEREVMERLREKFHECCDGLQIW